MKTSFLSVRKLLSRFLREKHRELSQIDFIVGVSRGGLIPAALIATSLDKPLVAAYIDREDRVYLDRGAWLAGKRALLVDDIIRTGKTFEKMLGLLARAKPKSIQSFTLYCLQSASVKPTWTQMVEQNLVMPWDE